MEKRHSVDQAYLRKVNQRTVLNNVFENDISSRAKIAKALSLSKPAIADNLRDLIELGILYEIGEGNTTPNGGRRPRLIQFNEGFKYIIAVDLNYEEPICALCNLRGKIISEVLIPVPSATSEEAYAKAIIGSIDALLAENEEISRDQIICIALCSPGQFDNNGKLLTWNQAFSGAKWCKVDYVTVLKNAFGVKVIVKNDIKAAAIGEWISAYQKGVHNMVFFSCGVGAGIGLILDSQPYDGEQYSAGEIYNYVDPAKYAGNKMLEEEICIAALQRRVKADILKGVVTSVRCAGDGEVDFESIVQAYHHNDPYILRQIENIALEIGCCLTNIVNLLNISHVVIAGEYLAFQKTLLQKMDLVFSKYCLNALVVKASALGRYQGICGLSYIAREWYFDCLCKKESTFE